MIVIDRFEGSLAVLETDNGNITLSRELLPDTAREGDILVYSGGRYIVDEAATAERRRITCARLKRLIGSKPQTDGDDYD